MARLSPITSSDQVPPEDRHAAEAIMGSRGQIGGPFSIMLYSPEIAERAAHLGAYIRFESKLPLAQVELVTLAAAREFDCDYAWGSHVSQALKAGVREEAVRAVANRNSLDTLDKEEAVLVGYVRELLRTKRVSEPTFAAARTLLGDRGLVEMTATVGYYGMLACTLNAFEVESAPGAAKLP